jgi:protocatechuate 3,4-dioxygenase beta subunit
VDFSLQSLGVQRVLGSTLTDEHGHFRFETFVPIDVRVGRYDITAQKRESDACQP